jgi:hypothetical protein
MYRHKTKWSCCTLNGELFRLFDSQSSAQAFCMTHGLWISKPIYADD